MGLWPIFVGRHILQRSTFNDSWIASQLSIGGYHHSWKFVNGEQSCADLSVLHLQWYQPTKNSFSFARKNIFGFPFFTFFRSCQSATPQKTPATQKKVSHPPLLFFWGAPPKKNTQQPTKNPGSSFPASSLNGFFFPKRERWEKLHGERPNLRMLLPWSYVRSCKSWRRPQVPNARRNGGRWGTGVGSLVLLNAGLLDPSQQKGWVACGFLGLNFVFVLLVKKRKRRQFFVECFFFFLKGD